MKGKHSLMRKVFRINRRVDKKLEHVQKLCSHPRNTYMKIIYTLHCSGVLKFAKQIISRNINKYPDEHSFKFQQKNFNKYEIQIQTTHSNWNKNRKCIRKRESNYAYSNSVRSLIHFRMQSFTREQNPKFILYFEIICEASAKSLLNCSTKWYVMGCALNIQKSKDSQSSVWTHQSECKHAWYVCGKQ